MTLNSQAHEDMMAFFERIAKRDFYNVRLDREHDKELWKKGRIYQQGDTNTLFLAFRHGAAYGEGISR